MYDDLQFFITITCMHTVMIIRSKNVKTLWKLDFADHKYFSKKLISTMYIVIMNIFGSLKLYIFEAPPPPIKYVEETKFLYQNFCACLNSSLYSMYIFTTYSYMK